MSTSRAIYRVVTDNYRGFEVQYRTPWWPFWQQCGCRGKGINTHRTLEEAEEFARKHARHRAPRRLVRVIGAIEIPNPQQASEAAE